MAAPMKPADVDRSKPAADADAHAFSRIDGLRYGALGLPLAFVALPLYVLLPNHYAREFGVSLTALGAVLLGARLFDALTDPLLGRVADRLFARGTGAVLGFGAVGAAVLLIGFTLLFFPQWLVDPAQHGPLLAVAASMLVLAYLGYSAVSVAHQSWGALLGGGELQRARIFSWREGLSLVGVVLASVVPTAAGIPAMVVLFALTLAVGWWLWTLAPRPVHDRNNDVQGEAADSARAALALPWHRPAFRRLLAVFVLNGIASAIPATLVLFFVQDRLQAAAKLEPAFLGSYFVCAALSIPLWLKAVPRFGLARTWLAGMLLAIVVFGWAALLGEGDAIAFLAVCALSGIALGTDLVLPSALLAGVIAGADTTTLANRTRVAPAGGAAETGIADSPGADAGADDGRASGDARHAGAYFGWWNFATKLNLALAAGLALPLLGLAGYEPGSRDPQALAALSFAYCALPVALKLLAAGTLWWLLIRPARTKAAPSDSSLSKAPS